MENDFSKKNVKFYLDRVKEKLTYCKRCKYIWIRHWKSRLPKHCPHCCSPYWKTKSRKTLTTKDINKYIASH